MACVPILFGCETKIKAEDGDNPPRICAKCHNPSVIKAKESNWFSLFCVPIFPFHFKHVYRCSICGWNIKQGDGFEPPIAGQQQPPQGYYPPNQGMMRK